jgi:hypothetical protein
MGLWNEAEGIDRRFGSAFGRLGGRKKVWSRKKSWLLVLFDKWSLAGKGEAMEIVAVVAPLSLRCRARTMSTARHLHLCHLVRT